MNSAEHQILIVGAGMAGLLAANMLRRFNPLVIESQNYLPHNHKALLRFRSPVVSDATAIPFRKVLVRKNIWDGSRLVERCNVVLANLYSHKVSGGYNSRSIWNMEPEHRWIAPDDFVEQLAKGVVIEYGTKWDKTISGHKPVISTLPLPLMTGRKDFLARVAWSVNATIVGSPCDVYQTVYNANPRDKWYRASIHGNHIIIEFMEPPAEADWNYLLDHVFGLHHAWLEKPLVSENKYGKLQPFHDEALRKQMIIDLTTSSQIFSLGRFATWRPLLLDDLVQDINKIAKMIGDKYFSRLAA